MKGKLAILGGGESGVGTAILGKKEGFEVFLSDFGTVQEKVVIPKKKYSGPIWL
jgi:UDP-N-acetylmuramoylalanine--D-glutamate ligase